LTVEAAAYSHRDRTPNPRNRSISDVRFSATRLQAAADLLKLGRYAWNPQTNELQ